jgi:hypothetical protein
MNCARWRNALREWSLKSMRNFLLVLFDGVRYKRKNANIQQAGFPDGHPLWY